MNNLNIFLLNESCRNQIKIVHLIYESFYYDFPTEIGRDLIYIILLFLSFLIKFFSLNLHNFFDKSLLSKTTLFTALYVVFEPTSSSKFCSCRIKSNNRQHSYQFYFLVSNHSMNHWIQQLIIFHLNLNLAL